MIILDKNTENSIGIGRNTDTPIAIFMINSWDKNLSTVLVSEIATVDETELLRKIAYKYAQLLWRNSSNRNVVDMFKECFDEYNTTPEKELPDDFYFNKGSRFIKNTYDSAQKAVDEIIRKVKDVSGVSIFIDMIDSNIKGIVYTISINDDKDTHFTFWNSTDWPEQKGEGFDLYIVPDYHPSSPSQGRKSYGLLINGATNALIRSTSIDSVYSPKEARREGSTFGTSWAYMKHPCKATGKSFTFTLGGHYHATQELVDDAVELIISALGADPNGHYVGISGGFYSIYEIANRTGRKLPIDLMRGSEKHCMWTHDVLKQEKELEKAYIPDWFIDEKWVNFFAKQKGIFPKF